MFSIGNLKITKHLMEKMKNHKVKDNFYYYFRISLTLGVFLLFNKFGIVLFILFYNLP